MGFDLYWENSATDEEVASSEDGEPEYFRLSVWEMAMALSWMELFGVLDASKLEKRLPQPVDFDLAYVPKRWDEDGNDTEYEPDSAEELYLCAREAARDGDSGGPIPAYKLRSNDGWLVTATEIERSLGRYDERLPNRDNQPREIPVPVVEDGEWNGEFEVFDWWGDWIDYLRAAVDHGGFRVF